MPTEAQQNFLKELEAIDSAWARAVEIWIDHPNEIDCIALDDYPESFGSFDETRAELSYWIAKIIEKSKEVK